MSSSEDVVSQIGPPSSRVSSASRMVPVIVTVIEAGPLEKQVCLLVESLRRWGGRLAAAPVVAVMPRFGPGLSRATQLTLERLDVEYCRIHRDDGFDWFPYLNKTAAVRYVAARQAGRPIVWLCADILVLDEPFELLPDERQLQRPQFAACASDKNIGTSRDDDEFAPYFRAACEALGVNFATLPYVRTEREHVAVRAYWNSGVYAFASESGLAELHHRFTLALLAQGIASHQSRLFFSDQVSLGLAAHYLGLTRKNLPLSHNFQVQPRDADARIREAGLGIRILHYHGCLWPPSFDKLCFGLEGNYPEVALWLRRLGPLVNEMAPVARVWRKTLELHRQRRYRSALGRAHLY